MPKNQGFLSFFKKIVKKKKKMNQINFWHDDKDSKSTKDGL